MSKRGLTSLEYIILGLIGLQPCSGYDIINFFAPAGAYSFSASPGSIYPALKRLDQRGIIEGNLEMEREMRPRKIYRLTASGEELLNAWIREIPSHMPLYEQRELAFWRFQFMEGRLSREEVLRWLEDFLDSLRLVDYTRRIMMDTTLAAMTEHHQESLHRQLILEATLMEINTLRTWLEMARARIIAAIQSGSS